MSLLPKQTPVRMLALAAAFFASSAFTPASATTTYLIDHQFFTLEEGRGGFVGIMSLTARFRTDQLGTFTTQAEVENFLNSGEMPDGGFIGAAYDEPTFGDAPFPFVHSGTWRVADGSVSITSTATELVIDLGPSRTFLVYGGGANGTYNLFQDGLTAVAADIAVNGDPPVYPPARFLEIPFDSAFRFPAIPEPSTGALLGVALAVTLRRSRPR